MSVTFSIAISQTPSEALKQIKERQFLARQKVCDILKRLNWLEEQELEDTEEFTSLMEQLENAESFDGYAFYELQMASLNFSTLNELLKLPTDEGDTGRISAEKFLLKVAHARQVILSPGGKEWERSEEPSSENGSFKIMATPGLECEDLENYLQQLQRIAEYAYANQADVKWA